MSDVPRDTLTHRRIFDCATDLCHAQMPADELSPLPAPATSCPEATTVPSKRVCPVPGCPNLTSGGRCPTCTTTADRARGTATERGYTGRGHRSFRAAVLRRDPICVLCDIATSTVADHYPISRRDLIAQGLDPNDPDRGRGLCAPCHYGATAQNQPGGFGGPDRSITSD